MDNSYHISYEYPAEPNQLKWCCMCARGGTKDDDTVCVDKKLFDLLWNGPYRVSPYGTCDRFVYKYSDEAKFLQKSQFVEKLIESTGIYRNR